MKMESNLSTNIYFAEYAGLEYIELVKGFHMPYFQGTSLAWYDGGKVWVGEFFNNPEIILPIFGNYFSSERLRFTTDWNWLIEIWKKMNEDFGEIIQNEPDVFLGQQLASHISRNEVTKAALFLEKVLRRCVEIKIKTENGK